MRDILNDGGNAVDAAIAVLLSEGVTGPQSMGIGGGFLATVYIKSKNLITTINAREAAPRNSSKYMFENVDVIQGGHASAIPSEIKGYWILKEKFGNPQYSWKKLFEPTIKLCTHGYEVDKFLGLILKDKEQQIRAEPSLSKIFINPATDQIYKEGETAYRPQLGETLKNISERGAAEFYGGVTGQNFIYDVRAMGGVLTMQDLIDYEVKENRSISLELGDGLTLQTIPLPGSGPVLRQILQLLKGRVAGVDQATLIHRMAEAMKHGYGLRSKLADSDYEPSVVEVLEEIEDPSYKQNLLKNFSDSETHSDTAYYGGVFDHRDHGTSNVAVIDQNGNAITATSTVNNVFGAFVRSEKTGIILNDEMGDFSTPNKTNSYGFAPSPINFIKAGQRPMSSMSPSIILDKNGNVRLLIGAAGGSQITTSTIVRHLLLNQPLYDAINDYRIHHQLMPIKLMYEKDTISEDVLEQLKAKHHEVQPKFVINIKGFSAVTGISVVNGVVSPVFDGRRGGSAVTTA